MCLNCRGATRLAEIQRKKERGEVLTVEEYRFLCRWGPKRTSPLKLKEEVRKLRGFWTD